MKLYHITTQESAEKIIREGFKGKKGGWYGRFDSKTLKPKYDNGVFFADSILNANDGLPIENPTIFVVEIPDELIQQYEWVQPMGYREWCIPTNIVNKYFRDKKYYKEEDFDDGKDPTQIKLDTKLEKRKKK